MKHYNIPVFIPHLGCPFQCIFCNQRNIAQQEPAPDSSDVRIMVQKALKTIPLRTIECEIEVAYFGGSFTAVEEELQEEYLLAVRSFIDEGLINGIRISTRPDFIDRAVLERLMKNGVKTIELGVQSLNDEVLRAAGRAYTADVVFSACRLIKQYGFKLGVQLMIGLPGDNYDRDMSTVKDTISLSPDMVRIYPVLVVKDTGLERLYEQGLYSPLELEEAIVTCCEMFLRFQAENIDVIRMGLHPSEELRGQGTVVAGPFHPAFGELVEQEAYKKQAEVLLCKFNSTGVSNEDINLFTSYRDLSKMIGNKKSNILYLNHLPGLPGIKRVQIDEQLKKDELGIGTSLALFSEMKLSRNEFLEIYLD